MDWNYTAVGDLLTFDHTLDDDTLTESRPYSAPIIEEARGDLAALTVSILKENITNPGGTVLSASGGFDSRLLLAALLHLGIRPRLLVCGPRGNFDRDVVEEMGKRLSLEVIAVELNAQDYVDHAERIVEVTGGTKAARHWHTYLYPLKAGLDTNSNIVVGANGESMRSYYFDRGLLAHATTALPSQPLLRKFWKAKAKNPFRPDQWQGLSEPVRENLYGQGSRRRIDRLVAASRGRDFLSSLDHFYYHQRVRNFIGDGLKLYRQFGEVVAPMTDRRWVAVAQSMPRTQKLGSRWHRHAIKSLCPELLSFPEQGTGRPMAVDPGRLYWMKKSGGGLPYADYANWFRSPAFTDMVMDRRDSIRELMSPDLVESLMKSGSIRQIAPIASLAVFASLGGS
ncbi:MAG: hypothetical protein IIB90_15990 [Gemmatimonadetes bacterium]|nr:hypothetical protein [Gemmatimonadota bacterium]